MQSFELSFQNSLQDYCFHLEGFRVFNCPLEHIFKAKNEHNLYRDELWGPFGSTGSGTGEGLLEDQTTRPWRHRHPHPAATTSGLQREGASPALCVRLVPWLTSQASGGQDADDTAFVLLAHACTHTHTHILCSASSSGQCQKCSCREAIRPECAHVTSQSCCFTSEPSRPQVALPAG